MDTALLLVDLITDFQHDDGELLLMAFADRHGNLVELLERARAHEVPIIYGNDNYGIWDEDARALIDRARRGPGGHLVSPIAPREHDRLVVKPRYSAFDSTPLQLILEKLGTRRLALAGMATEMCVTYTAIAASELGYQVIVVEDACAALDPDNERLALAYLERVVGVELTSSRSFPRV
jgi:nicotinamidase-related amidase